jgi:NAD(P)-dependent dehydrogenase (short-subunit alcohol dehydrogenase family)
MISFINDPNELKGRRALVTGGSRGIGGAIVRRLLSAGARVVAVARIPVEDFPADAVWIQGDVRSVEGVQAIVEQVSATLGGVDILVNNVCGC